MHTIDHSLFMVLLVNYQTYTFGLVWYAMTWLGLAQLGSAQFDLAEINVVFRVESLADQLSLNLTMVCV